MRIRVVSENEYMSLTVALISYLRFAVVELAGSIKHAINNTLGTEALIVQKAKAFSTTGVFLIFLGPSTLTLVYNVHVLFFLASFECRPIPILCIIASISKLIV